MSLPMRATVEDIDAICGYLATKPTGATRAEIRAVVDKKHLDTRKMAALKVWGLVDEGSERLKITEKGREAVRDSGAHRSNVLRDVIRQTNPYVGLIERVVHRQEKTLHATDIAAHWYEHFSGEVSGTESVLNSQTLCFLHIAQGADLGVLTIGRKGLQTRFDFDTDAVRTFFEDSTGMHETPMESDDKSQADDDDEVVEDWELGETTEPTTVNTADRGEIPISNAGNRVFITHGKNLKILEQVKQIVEFGKFEPIVAMERETAAMPVPQKVMADMRTCDAAVIHVSAERELYDADGTLVPQINENVLIEIGAAMALYEKRFVLLVEEGVSLPSNLQGLYECRYSGEELSMTAFMKLLEAFNDFRSQ